jgi:hypothetical protein
MAPKTRRDKGGASGRLMTERMGLGRMVTRGEIILVHCVS